MDDLNTIAENIVHNMKDWNLSDFEKDAAAEWDKIPKVSGYPDAEPMTDSEQCPHCGTGVNYIDDIYPPDDCIGIERLNHYTSRVYRKCDNCGKVYYEDLGEKPDYAY